MLSQFAYYQLPNYTENANFKIRISQNAKIPSYAPLLVNPRGGVSESFGHPMTVTPTTFKNVGHPPLLKRGLTPGHMTYIYTCGDLEGDWRTVPPKLEVW